MQFKRVGVFGKKTKVYRLRLTEELFEALKKEAQREGCSINILINERLEKSVRKPKK